MGVALFVFSGLLRIAAEVFLMVVAPEMANDTSPAGQAILYGVGTGCNLFSAWMFLASVLKSKQFLSARGIELPDFGPTVAWFIVPFANFYVPWKRLALIRIL